MRVGDFPVERVGAYMLLRDADGLRHLARISAMSLVSETDPVGDEVCLIVSGRPIRIHACLADVLKRLGTR
jgi:hypothetical protein